MKVVRILVAIVLGAALPLMAVADSVATGLRVSPTDENAIRKTVEQIRSAIAARDINTLLKLISPTEGLSCTDTKYRYAEAKRFLRDHGSTFYTSLFDTTRFRQSCGSSYPPEYPAISELEFYATASQEVLIESSSSKWAKVTIKSPIKSHYERWMYLHREGNSWKAAGGSFVIGECTCGG